MPEIDQRKFYARLVETINVMSATEKVPVTDLGRPRRSPVLRLPCVCATEGPPLSRDRPCPKHDTHAFPWDEWDEARRTRLYPPLDYGLRAPRIVFCDFDGVLNTSAHWSSLPADRTQEDALVDALSFDAQLVSRLSALCRRARAGLVVSSSWVWRYPDPSLDGLTRLLTRHGFQGLVVGAVGTGDEGRGADIEAWLAELRLSARYVVLDDTPLSGASAATEERHIRTDMTKGLTDEDVERALSFLIHFPPACFRGMGSGTPREVPLARTVREIAHMLPKPPYSWEDPATTSHGERVSPILSDLRAMIPGPAAPPGQNRLWEVQIRGCRFVLRLPTLAEMHDPARLVGGLVLVEGAFPEHMEPVAWAEAQAELVLAAEQINNGPVKS